MAVEVGVVAEADAHRHQSEGNRESEKNDDDEYAQHEEGDLRISHGRLLSWLPSPVDGRTISIASEPCARMSCAPCSIKRTSVSSMSSAASSHSPVRMQWMQRKTCAMPCNVRRRPAATMIALSWNRSEESSVGQECVSTCGSRWSTDH